MPYENCTNQDSRIANDLNGCFVMIHDDWVQNVTYNSLNDMMDYVK